ncbi:hypothetical protein J3E69DRAFT_320592 [Trichoderma sp. SZMC 28015]
MAGRIDPSVGNRSNQDKLLTCCSNTAHCNAATTDAIVSYPHTVCIQQDSLLTFPTLYSYMQAEIRGACCWYEHDQLSIQLTSNGIAG